MTESHDIQSNGNSDLDHKHEYEAYGWEFHKKPLFIAAVITALFYAFVFFYVKL